MNLPKARTSDILEQEADKELLIYDLRIDQAYNLNETSKIVFNACAKQISFDELKRRHRFTDDLIHLTLDELKRSNLVEDYQSDHFKNLSRREVVKRVGLATMIALPIISSLIAPTAAQAQSGALRANGQPCASGAECQSNTCGGTGCCSAFYQNSSPCTSISDCCNGGNGAIFCDTNGVGTPSVCCSRSACLSTSQCCAGRTCVGSICSLIP